MTHAATQFRTQFFAMTLKDLGANSSNLRQFRMTRGKRPLPAEQMIAAGSAKVGLHVYKRTLVHRNDELLGHFDEVCDYGTREKPQSVCTAHWVPVEGSE